MEKTAKLKINDSTFELPLLEGTEGEIGVDISSLRAQSGVITLDKGFKNTGSTKSAITFLNGEEGILRYRGYSIEELSSKSSFLEVAFLLIYGELPTKEELNEFTNEISSHTLVHEDVKSILDGFSFKSSSNGGFIFTCFIINSFLSKIFGPKQISRRNKWNNN